MIKLKEIKIINKRLEYDIKWFIHWKKSLKKKSEKKFGKIKQQFKLINIIGFSKGSIIKQRLKFII